MNILKRQWKNAKIILYLHFGAWNFSEAKDGTIVQDRSPSFRGMINYKTFIKELIATSFNGYYVSEYCLSAIKDRKIARIEEIDHATQITLQFMKQLVQQYAPTKLQKSMS